MIRGQLLDQAGARLGAAGFPISDGRFFAAADPSIAWDAAGNRYTVVYTGAVAGDGVTDVFGQLLAADGVPTGSAGFTVADRGFDRNPSALAYNPARCEFLAAWEGIHAGDAKDPKTEAYARRIRDGSALARVDVFVDGKRVRRTSRSRFTIRLSERALDAGRHTVRIVARDAAGNRAVRRIHVRRCAERVVLPRFAG